MISSDKFGKSGAIVPWQPPKFLRVGALEDAPPLELSARRSARERADDRVERKTTRRVGREITDAEAGSPGVAPKAPGSGFAQAWKDPLGMQGILVAPPNYFPAQK